MTELVRTYKLTDSGAWGWVTEEAEGGGGGSLPSWWTVDSTPGSESVEFAGAVTISPSDAAAAYLSQVLLPTNFDFGTNYTYYWQAVSKDGTTQVYGFDTTGDLNMGGEPGQGPSGIVMSSVDDPTRGFRVFSGGNGRLLQGYIGSKTVFKVTDAGIISTGANVAPADGDLQNEELAVWFDSANGAAKLMIKAKDENGAVVLGEVALA